MKKKGIPKVVILYIGLVAFYIGTILAGIPLIVLPSMGLDLILGVAIWTLEIITGLSLAFLIAWRYKETIEEWLPRRGGNKKK